MSLLVFCTFSWTLAIPAICLYPAILSLLFVLCVCTVTDFSARALPIGVKFCMVRPDPGQVFCFLGDTPGIAEFWASAGYHMAGYASC